MILRYTPRARRDLESILAYVAERSPQGAANVAASVAATMEFIAANPRASPRTSISSLHVRIVAGFPYKVFCRLREDAIEIIHIRHAARRPWPRS